MVGFSISQSRGEPARAKCAQQSFYTDWPVYSVLRLPLHRPSRSSRCGPIWIWLHSALWHRPQSGLTPAARKRDRVTINLSKQLTDVQTILRPDLFDVLSEVKKSALLMCASGFRGLPKPWRLEYQDGSLHFCDS